MNIIETQFKWAAALKALAQVRYVVLHHAAGDGSAEAIHKAHLANGWSGIGYHLYVRKSGQVFRGRPIDRQGAHCTGYNGQSVGICFEGNFETETMCAQQAQAGAQAVRYALGVYPGAGVVRHKELASTACPGRLFPFEAVTEIEEDETMTGEEIYLALQEYVSGRKMPDWAQAELAQAVSAGITDGSEPMALIPRYQAAIMALRGAK